jgi:hypothetical protein
LHVMLSDSEASALLKLKNQILRLRLRMTASHSPSLRTTRPCKHHFEHSKEIAVTNRGRLKQSRLPQ